MDAQPTPRRLAILGGGVAAVTAAFRLTSEPDWQERFQITLYQQGWRLGGKGASGRRAEAHQRIEEHGIHVWLGFYYNAFQCLRQCYAELDRPAGAPLATVEDAFHPHSHTAFAHAFGGHWTTWPIETLALPGRPGEGWNPKPFMTALGDVLAWLLRLGGRADDAESANAAPGLLARLADHLREDLVHGLLGKAAAQLDQARHQLATAPEHDHGVLTALLESARSLLRRVLDDRLGEHLELERLWLLLDFGLTILIGLLADRVCDRGFEALNDEAFHAWLARHGASADTLEGPVLNALHGGIFAYRDGDPAQPDVETGTLLRAAMLALTTAKGAFIWRMEAGMGDVVFAPYYEVLRRRGVTFRFFHQVAEVCAEDTPAGPQVTRLRLNRQAPLKGEDYQPLVDVRGLPCWPSAPRYEQLRDDVAAQLQAEGIDLESSWSGWQGEPVELQASTDFDDVILGISVAGLAHLCPSLAALDPAFARMTTSIATVATQAVQLWQDRDVWQLGWTGSRPGGQAPELLGFNAQAMDSWAEVSYLVDREDWPRDAAPRDISYFCGVFAPTRATPPVGQRDTFPAEQAERVFNDFVAFLDGPWRAYWPEANPSGQGYRWDFLTAPSGVTGQARLRQQYWRANVDHSERYVQSVTGSSRWRLPTDGTRFGNLYLTGDWIRNGFNMGCVESATLSGLQTARALLGHGEVLPGEDALQ